MQKQEYQSLFSVISEKEKDFFQVVPNADTKRNLRQFSGTVGDALDTSLGSFNRILHTGLEGIDTSTIMRFLLMNGRIFRGISIMKQIKQGNSLDFFGLIDKLGDITISGMNLMPEYSEALSEFSGELGTIMDLHITQKPDLESWRAMKSDYSEESGSDINNMLGNEDYLFIALGNGGTMPGFDVYLRLKEKTGDRGVFYPVRFSRVKSKDQMPLLTLKEKTKLQSLAKDRVIVIFDEDSSSGNTILKAQEFFRNQFPESKDVICRTNLGRFGHNTHL